jgi:hypothetical protein
MTSRCRYGHESEAADYCDQCGSPIEVAVASPGPPVAAPGPPVAAEPVGPEADDAATDEVTQRSPPAPTERCPQCGTPRVEGGRYCEVDGHDFSPPAVRWWVEVTADRQRYDAEAPDGLAFPEDYLPRTFALDGEEVLIGRRAPSPPPNAIDLGGTPEDQAISRRHAVLRRTADGAYALIDCGSTNGTSLGRLPAPLEPGVAVALIDGDQIYLGAWTRIAVHATPE